MPDYMLVDADNHYYDAEDAFTRYGDDEVKRYVRWVREDKRKRLMIGGVLSEVPGNPTFNPIAKPGAFHQRLKELEAGKRRVDESEFAQNRYGELVPLPDGYRYNDARLVLLDEQGVEKCFLFPTLAECVEGLMMDDPVMAHKAFTAYNRWVEDDWGYHYKDRLYAAPYIAVRDPQLAADELERVIAKGARIVSVRPGPFAGRSPADPAFNRFWSIVNESQVLVAFHAYGGRTVYSDSFDAMYAADKRVSDRVYHRTLMMALMFDRGIIETTMALVLGNLFGRFPKVRVASIEMGMNWVPYVLHAMDHAGGLLIRDVKAFGQKVEELPSDIFKRHVWVSPFPEEDVVGLTEMIGVSQVLFGSDFPHPEGNVMPADYTECIEKLPKADIKKIMRENADALLAPSA